MTDILVPHEHFVEAVERKQAELDEIRRQGTIIIGDLELACNLIIEYQRSLSILGGADPSWYRASDLLKKYGLSGIEPNGGKIFVDSTDITVYPNTEATAEEIETPELEETNE